MEHLLIYLIHFILWLDRKSQKSVRRTISNLDELLETPETVLAQGDIVIGPFKRWASGIVLGLLFSLIGSGFWLYVFSSVIRKKPGAFATGEAIFFSVVMGVIVLTAFWLTRRWLRGGEMILRLEEVEMRHKGTVVRCPWSLFNARGNPFQPSKDRVLIPVAPGVVPYVKAYRENTFISQGSAVKTKMLQFKSSSLAVLRSIYASKINGVGLLLLRLGKKLGKDAPETTLAFTQEEQKPQKEKPVVIRKGDGWISATLTHLNLPPYCCDCETATRATKEYQVQSYLGEIAGLSVPICPPCQRRHERIQRSAIGRGIFMGVGIGVGAATLLALVIDPVQAVLFGILFALLGLTSGAIIGTRNGRQKSQPILIRGYSPSGGTVSLWFRNPRYEEAVVLVMGGETEEQKLEEPALRW